jgi:hypothetical protein
MQQIAIVSRRLELLLARRFLHALLETAEQLPVPAFKEHSGFLDLLPIVLPGDQPCAGPRALIELVVEAGTRPAPVEPLVTDGDPEEPRHHAERLARPARRKERAEVQAAVQLRPSHQDDPRKGIPESHLEIGEVLVVPHEDVVTGPLPLDEVVLEDQGFRAAGGENQLEIPDLGDQGEGLGRVLGALLEVGADPAAQRGRLADVKNAAAAVLIDVDPGSLGKLGELVLQEKLPGLRRQMNVHRCLPDSGAEVDLLQEPDPIPQLRGALELEVGGRLLHFRPQGEDLALQLGAAGVGDLVLSDLDVDFEIVGLVDASEDLVERLDD